MATTRRVTRRLTSMGIARIKLSTPAGLDAAPPAARSGDGTVVRVASPEGPASPSGRRNPGTLAPDAPVLPRFLGTRCVGCDPLHRRRARVRPGSRRGRDDAGTTGSG